MISPRLLAAAVSGRLYALTSAERAGTGRAAEILMAGLAWCPCLNPSMPLRHSVEGDVRDGRQFHGHRSLRACGVVQFDRTAAAISSVVQLICPCHVNVVIPHK
jgi:hypothetical protein